ncbi:MAG: ZIP family metal transporter [Firmicutes bacterium]|nr:ZIP family metal transporter [Bacillota bacterium]
MNVLNSFILTFLAGFATMVGYLVIYLPYKYKDNIINASLSFAVGVMVTISIFDLIPESFNLLFYNDFCFKLILILIFIVVGVCFSIIMDRVVPNSNFLYKIGLVSLFSIIMHNIPEGVITFITANNNSNLGIKIAVAIALHNIPEGISIAVPLYYSTKNKKKVFTLLLISALSEPLGAVLGLILSKYITTNILGFIYAFIVGLMLYISLYEILPATTKYKRYLFSAIFMIVGGLIMFSSFILLD